MTIDLPNSDIKKIEVSYNSYHVDLTDKEEEFVNRYIRKLLDNLGCELIEINYLY
jgi:hypothetical protein